MTAHAKNSQSSDNGEKISGLRISLRKQQAYGASDISQSKEPQPNKTSPQRSRKEYAVWGYYDEMTVEPIRGWSDLSPVDNDQHDSVNGQANDEILRSDLSLSLISPLGDDRIDWEDNSQSTGFDFDYDVFTQSDNDQPFIIVAMLHYSKSAKRLVIDKSGDYRNGGSADVHDYGRMNRLLQRNMCDSAAALGYDNAGTFRELHCSTYYAVGFSDMVIVFRTKRIDMVSDLLLRLRLCDVDIPGSADADARNKDSFLFTTYAICGIRSDYCEQSSNVDGGLERALSDIRVSIRILLKSGVSALSVYRDIRKRLQKRSVFQSPSASELFIKSFPDPESPEGFGHALSHTFGNSDMLLLPELPLFYFLNEYLDRSDSAGRVCDGIFSSKSEFRQKRFLSTRATIRRVPNRANSKLYISALCEEPRSQNNAQACLIKDLNNELEDILKSAANYYKISREYIRDKYGSVSDDSFRYVRYIRQILLRCVELIRLDHLYDLFVMLKPVLDLFKENIETLISKFNILVEATARSDRGRLLHEEELLRFIKNADDNIETFGNELNELLIDFTRSSRMYVEGKALLHPSIGSATKLILSYGTILRYLSRVVQMSSKRHSGSTYAFLLSSGGLTDTKCKLYFKNLHSSVNKNQKYISKSTILEHRLMRMMIPERTLYAQCIAIYMMMHECLHYVGARDYIERAKCVIKSTLAAMTYNLCRWYSNYAENGIGSDTIRLGVSDDIKRKIISEFDSQLLERGRDAQKYYTDMFFFETANDKFNIDIEDCFSSRITNAVYNKIVGRFVASDSIGGDDQVFSSFSDRYERDLACVWVALAQKYEAKDKHSLFPHIARIRAEGERVSQMSQNGFRNYLGILLGNENTSAETGADTANEINGDDTNFSIRNLYETIDLIFQQTKEIFADVLTCRYLGCSSDMYLYVALYSSDRGIMDLPMCFEVILRFGCILTIIDENVANMMTVKDNMIFTEQLENILSGYKTALKMYCGVASRTEYSENYVNDDRICAFIDHIGNILRRFQEQFHQTRIAEPIIDYIANMWTTHESATGSIRDDESFQRISRMFRCDLCDYASDGSKIAYGNKAEIWKDLLYFWQMSFCELENHAVQNDFI